MTIPPDTNRELIAANLLSLDGMTFQSIRGRDRGTSSQRRESVSVEDDTLFGQVFPPAAVYDFPYSYLCFHTGRYFSRLGESPGGRSVCEISSGRPSSFLPPGGGSPHVIVKSWKLLSANGPPHVEWGFLDDFQRVHAELPHTVRLVLDPEIWLTLSRRSLCGP